MVARLVWDQVHASSILVIPSQSNHTRKEVVITMATTDEVEKAQWDLDKAYGKLTRSKPSAGAGTEASYGQAYQRLVLLGVKPQIRKKYRVYTG
jgi:hypothetical protein